MDRIGPEHVIDNADPGDETLRRYRYQTTYAAALAIDMLDEASRLEAIFCEHHDDILMRFKGPKFRAVQVKTRDEGQDLLKAGDPDVLAAIVRFVRLTLRFPDEFIGFEIATNYAFFRRTENGSNLPYLIELAMQWSEAEETHRTLARYIKKIKSEFTGDEENRPSDKQIVTALAIVSANDQPPKMANMARNLRDRIGAHFSDKPIVDLEKAARALSTRTFEASSKTDEDANYGYAYIAVHDAESRKDSDVILAKELKAEEVRKLLMSELADQISLTTKRLAEIELPNDFSVLEQKLAAGGLSTTTRYAAEDCLASTEKQGADWIYKYGQDQALARHRHLSAIALNESSLAYECTKSDNGVFGPAMYAELESRLKHRVEDNGTETWGSTKEHLFGHVFRLTQECKIFWSKVFRCKKVG